MSGAERTTGLEIAIVGMAGRFPGAPDLARYWANLAAGVESIERFGDEELRAAGVSGELLADPAYVRAAGVIPGIELFDSALFGFTPREAEILDPQHRLLLECAWEALEDAGCDPRTYRRLIGVYAGSKYSPYYLNVCTDPEVIAAVGHFQALLANDKDYLATRVAYELDLIGPAVTVQTACSTSLVAVHLACQGLLGGECDMALAGGVSIGLPQRTGYLWIEGGILSPDGHCRAFDAEARGTVNGHGLGLVVLKRLGDALADGDRIYAVIKGSAVNNDGAGKVGYTAPSPSGQERVIRAAQDLAEVEPDTIGYVEAHGTGTALGDPVEIAALTRAFRARTSRRGFCALGSVKTNIGHLDTAAGVAGLIKAALALHYKTIPPSLHCAAPNPDLRLEESPFYVATRAADWPEGDAPRRAGVSSFGIGGTNVHVVLEEAPAPASAGPARPWQLLVLSAATSGALEVATDRLAARLAGSGAPDVADVADIADIADAAFTLQVGRRRLAWRRTLVCRDRAEAAALLSARDPERVVTRRQEPGDRPLALLFPGQGAQRPGMGRGLYEAEPAFRAEVDRAAELLAPHLGLDLRTVLYPPGGDPEEAAARLAATALAQPALFVTGYALARLLGSWGLVPEIMAGHSVGEYVAACLAGVFSLEDALALVAARGRLLQALPGGAMLAVPLPEDEAMAELSGGLALAAVNGPASVVAAGPEEEVEALSLRLSGRGLSCRRLRTSHAFHSPAVEPAQEPFARELARVRLSPPALPFFSNVTGEPIRAEEAADPCYWVRHLRAPVRFGAALAGLWREPSRILLEAGPGRALTTLARQHPGRPEEGLALAALPDAGSGERDVPSLLAAVGRLWLAGAPVDWAGFHAGSRRRRVALPSYPFERRRHWVEGRWAGLAGLLPSLPAPAPEAASAMVATVPADPMPAVPAPEVAPSRPGLDAPYVAPRTPGEQAVAAVWEAVLGVSPIGVHDDFFELGGSSLTATQLGARLRAVLGADLPLSELLAHPTVAGNAALLARRGTAAGVEEAPPILVPDPAAVGEPFPLTEVQQAYWIGRGDALALGNVATHYYLEVEVEALDVPRFERALVRTIERQHMLRAVMLPDGRQRILPRVPPFRIPVVDLSARTEAEAEAGALAVRQRMSHQVLPVDRWPLFDLAACLLPEGRTRLHIGFDFLLGDAWSLQLLLAELARAYRDPDAAAPPLALSFRDYVLAEERLAASPAFERALAYWRERLSGLPPAPELPLAQALETLAAPRFSRRQGVLPSPVWERLKGRAARAGLTPSGVLLAAYADVLAAWSARPRFTLSLTLFNRQPLHPQVNELVGDFTSVVLLEVDVSGDEGFEARARSLQARLWQDLDHRAVSGVRVLRELARTQGRAAGVAVPVVFTSLLGLDAAGGQGQDGGFAGLAGREVYSISQTPQVLLDHQTGEESGALVFNWDFVAEAFPPGLVEAMFDAYVRLLFRLATEEEAWQKPERGLLPAAQLALRARVNDTAAPLSDATLHGLFQRQAALAPERPAVISPDRTLTYGELARRAGRLARLLAELGARPGRPVAVVLERGWQQAVAVLAVLEAGAAYVPIDPALPAERRQLLFEQAEAGLALTTPLLDAGLDWPLGVERLWVEDEAPAGALPPLAEAAGPDGLAYVIFTSGSTGVPKGVEITHRGAVNTILDINRRFGMGPEDRVLAVSALSFDLSVYDLFGLFAAGGAAVTIDPWAARDPARWAELAAAASVTVWSSVPALLEMLVEHAGGRQGVVPPSLRLAMLSGDWIPVTLPGRLRTLAPEARLVSLGGATEVSIWSIFHEVERVDPAWTSIPYGRPLANQTFHVLDERLEPRPVWVPGDLWIGGAGLARGYFRDAEKTGASFVVHPRTGERLYRTGDRGRCLPDGDIEFLGREDLQVKIRGHRIELAEIEAALLQHPAVESCAAGAVGERGDRRLLAWAVPRPGRELAAADLERFLAARLPAHMVPSAFMTLDRLPLTANGKVDRKALSALSIPGGSRQHPAAGAAARTPAEEILCGLCAELLDGARVAPGDNFFDLGGHSLLATRLVSRMREAFGVELSLRRVFEAPNVAALAQAVERERLSGAGMEVPPILAVPMAEGNRILPLSFAQQRLWFLKQLVPDSAVYNVHVALRAGGRLDVAALAASLDAVVARHEVLRTTLPLVEGRPVQVIHPHTLLALGEIDLAGLPRAAAEAEVDRVTARELRTPFPFDRPLVRTRLLRLAPEEHVLLFLSHHIVWDDWSQGILRRDLAAFYLAATTGRPAALPPLSVQYADFSAWQREWLEGGLKDRLLGYWERQLAGIPLRLELPADRPRPAEQSFRGGERTRPIPAALAEALRSLARARGTTFFIATAAIYQALLGRLSGQQDFVVGTLIGNRNRPETENLIGFFVNTLVLRAGLAGDPPFAAHLERVRETALAAYDHQDLSFEKLIEVLKLPRDLGYNPLTQVVFNQFNAETADVPLPGLTLAPLATDAGWAPFDLNVTITGRGPSLLFEAQYATDLFDPATMDRLLAWLETLAAGAVERPETPLSALPVLSAAERAQLADWNDTVRHQGPPRCLHELVAAQAALTPGVVAVACEGEELTYRQLDRRANALARRLRELGAGPDGLVGIAAERSLELMVGLLAILKAGAAYLPLDPSYPQERLAWMAGDARLPLLLVQERLRDRIPAGEAQPVPLAADPGEADPPDSGTDPDNLAYVLYTSGSTGRPKGVMNTHRGIVNRLRWMQEEYGLGPEDRVLQKTPTSFDVSVWELFWPLIAGARLVLARPDGHRDGAYLAALIARESVTTAHFVPSLLNAFVEVPGAGELPSLRRVIASGEALPRELARRFATRVGAPLHNLYGPTEAAVDVTAWPCAAEGEDSAGVVPIGRPVANTAIRLLGPDLAELPPGVPGELGIAGVQLARGYLGRPDLTAERFVPDPWGEPGARLYRTGDLARHRADGALEFLGRIDHQVKIRGFRIELQEIEAVLAEHLAVRTAAVLVRGDGGGGGSFRLVAFVAGEAGAEELAAFLAGRLPEHMIPSAWVFLPELPLTSSGKIDRQALSAAAPMREAREETSAATGYMAPRTPAEEVLAAIWAEVLGRERVGVEDNFFRMGGDSILSIQVIARAHGEGLAITPNQIFQHQTVARLAAAVEAAGPGTFAPADQGPVAGPVPLTPIQRWFFELGLPEPHHFNQYVLLESAERLDPAHLASAVRLLAEHHDALRLRFERGASGWSQRCAELASAAPAPFSAFDLGALPADARGAALAAAASSLQASLDLAAGPLWRVALFGYGPGESQRLLVVVHHLAIDGVSWRILLTDLEAACRQLARGLRPALPPKSTSFQRWSESLVELSRSGAFTAQEGYWLERAAVDLPLPVDFAGGEDREGAAGTVTAALSFEETRALLEEIPQAYGADVQETLLTALARALARWTGVRRVRVDLEGHGREDLIPGADLSRTVGWFTALFPVLLEVDTDAGPGEALMVIKEQLRSVPARGVGYGLLRYLAEGPAAARLRAAPGSSVLFNYLGRLDHALPPGTPFRPAAEPAGPARAPRGRRSHPLEVNALLAGGRLEMVWTYASTRYRPATVEALAGAVVAELAALAEHCRSDEAGGFTPSDFPAAPEVTQEELDRILSQLG
jgi:amino acid adenylation domain-containing protein/non-ribosomal peptide synthase protein (TIGR01720 family)